MWEVQVFSESKEDLWQFESIKDAAEVVRELVAKSRSGDRDDIEDIYLNDLEFGIQLHVLLP